MEEIVVYDTISFGLWYFNCGSNFMLSLKHWSFIKVLELYFSRNSFNVKGLFFIITVTLYKDLGNFFPCLHYCGK